MRTFSKFGFALALLYLLATAYLIGTQGLFGESFIVIVLGLPWTLLFSFFEYWGATDGLLLFLIGLPLVLNTFLLYWVGSLFGGLASRR